MINKIKLKMRNIWRQRRMLAFLNRMAIKNNTKIIDLGGTPYLWEMIGLDLNVTLLNMENIHNRFKGPFKHHYCFIKGDACNVTDFADNEFDVVFSNSVIEHVGSSKQQEAFAKTVHRLAPSYWVQTPSFWFPIEAHCNMPFWWFYPQSVKQAWIHQCQRQGRYDLGKMMSQTRVLKLNHLKSLFPDAQVYTEYVAGFPKSYSMYKLETK